MANVRTKCLACAIGAVSFLSLSAAPATARICPLPRAFAEGRIQSAWVGVVLDFNGEHGSPRSATVYTTTLAPDGIRLIALGTVQARGDDASDLHAAVIDDKLYFVNVRYISTPTGFQPKQLAFEIQRFAIRNGNLAREAEGAFAPSVIGYTLVGPGTDGGDCGDYSRFDASLKKAIESGTLEHGWTDAKSPP